MRIRQTGTKGEKYPKNLRNNIKLQMIYNKGLYGNVVILLIIKNLVKINI